MGGPTGVFGIFLILSHCLTPWSVLGQSLAQRMDQLPGIFGSDKATVALKLQPARKLRLSKSDLSSLLLDLRHEVKKQVSQLEEELAERARLRQRAKSTWSAHGAPIWIPAEGAANALQPSKPRMQEVDRIDGDSESASSASYAEALQNLEGILATLGSDAGDEAVA